MNWDIEAFISDPQAMVILIMSLVGSGGFGVILKAFFNLKGNKVDSAYELERAKRFLKGCDTEESIARVQAKIDKLEKKISIIPTQND